MAKPVRLHVFEGPGSVERFRGALVGRQWSLLMNISPDRATEISPAAVDSWRKKQVVTVTLDVSHARSAESEELLPDQSMAWPDWQAHLFTDDQRPSRRTLIVETPQVVVGVGVGPSTDQPPTGRTRVLLIDASWTHVSDFPDREEVRAAFVSCFRASGGAIHYITELEWDAALFDTVAEDLGSQTRAYAHVVCGQTARKLWQARQVLADVTPVDMVLIGLVPGRDDRGRFQQLRSDFAERSEHVRAFPTTALSTGPGPSRDESMETVGLWLPTEIMIVGGPISEQVLLARYFQENLGGSPVSVAVTGGEYRLPGLELIRHADVGHRPPSLGRQRGNASRSGLVVVVYGRDESKVSLAGTGLSEGAESVLPKIQVNRRGKTPEQVVREVEMAFSSRGLPVPAVRFLG